MERYEDKIEKALQYLKSPSRTDARGVSPIVYLVYKPEDAIIIRNVIANIHEAKIRISITMS